MPGRIANDVSRQKIALLPRLFGLLLVCSIFALGSASAAEAATSSQNVALVPNATGLVNNGGELPTTNFPNGYSPAFTPVSPDTIANASSNPLAGYDTVVLVGICNIGNYLAIPQFKSRIEAFVFNGGKLLIWDAECQATDYSSFVFPFTSNNPGAQGAPGLLTDVEENTLSSNIPASPYYVNDAAVSTDAEVGDANVFVTFNPNWCTDLRATNINGVNGPTQTYAHYGAGLIVYSGLDKDALFNGIGFDAASADGAEHLARIWLFELQQPFNPDSLPCGVRVFGLSLSPKTATNPAGTSHTVTAHVTSNASPVPNVPVTFTVTAGPNKGTTGAATTDANGDAKFTYTSNGSAGTDTIEASATLVGAGGQPKTVSDSATKTWVGGPAPADVTIAKSDSPDPVLIGQVLTYTLTARNTGPGPATNVTVTDALPSGVTFQSATASQGSCSQSGTTVTCSLGALSAGQTATVQIKVKPQQEGTITNTATIRATETDPNPANNRASTTTTARKPKPASLLLSPKSATNFVDDQHCVTASVKDELGQPAANVTVRFTVNGAVTASGSSTTGANGEARFCYSGPAFPGADTIRAFADTNKNGQQDAGEPGDVATKNWVLPAPTAGCKVTQGGRIAPKGGTKATFGGNVHADGPKGEEQYTDHDRGLDVHSTRITRVNCSADGRRARIFGTATVNRKTSTDFRIDVTDVGEPGVNDTYRLRLATGYDPGEQKLVGGNVQIHR